MFSFLNGHRTARKLAQAALAEAKFTPDNLLLENGSHFYFEYSRRKSGFASNRDIGRPRLCEAWTHDGFYVWTKRDGADSFALASRDYHMPQMPRTRVYGDLYLLPPDKIRKLDELHENTLKFKRKLVKICTPFMDDDKPFFGDNTKQMCVSAWMYFAADSWKPEFEFENGFKKPGNHRFAITTLRDDLKRPNLGRHYNFCQKDCYVEPIVEVEEVKLNGAELDKKTLEKRRKLLIALAAERATWNKVTPEPKPVQLQLVVNNKQSA